MVLAMKIFKQVEKALTVALEKQQRRQDTNEHNIADREAGGKKANKENAENVEDDNDNDDNYEDVNTDDDDDLDDGKDEASLSPVNVNLARTAAALKEPIENNGGEGIGMPLPIQENWGLSCVKAQQNCNAHKLQLILKDFFNELVGNKLASDMQKYIISLVTFLRRKRINVKRVKKLGKKKLKAVCSTRWNTVASVLERLLEVRVK